MRTGEPQPHSTQRVAHGESDMGNQRRIECAQTGLGIGILRRLHFAQHIGMAAYCALAEDDEAARENIRAFNGDGDGNLLIRATHEVARPQANALAAEDVHRIIHHQARTFGHMVFDNRRSNGRMLAQIHRTGGHPARRVH